MKYINLTVLAGILLTLAACSDNQYSPKPGTLSLPPLYEEVPNGSKS